MGIDWEKSKTIEEAIFGFIDKLEKQKGVDHANRVHLNFARCWLYSQLKSLPKVDSEEAAQSLFMSIHSTIENIFRIGLCMQQHISSSRQKSQADQILKIITTEDEDVEAMIHTFNEAIISTQAKPEPLEKVQVEVDELLKRFTTPGDKHG